MNYSPSTKACIVYRSLDLRLDNADGWMKDTVYSAVSLEDKKSWTGSFSPERNLGNLSDWASKSAIGQIYLISEGLTREAGHHFRCMKHFANLWNTYGDALFTLENFINSYMFKKVPRRLWARDIIFRFSQFRSDRICRLFCGTQYLCRSFQHLRR